MLIKYAQKILFPTNLKHQRAIVQDNLVAHHLLKVMKGNPRKCILSHSAMWNKTVVKNYVMFISFVRVARSKYFTRAQAKCWLISCPLTKYSCLWRILLDVQVQYMNLVSLMFCITVQKFQHICFYIMYNRWNSGVPRSKVLGCEAILAPQKVSRIS